MNYYGAKDLAAAFRTVRKNTLIVAEEIPEDKYSFRPAEGTKTVGEQLTHIALGPRFQEQINLIEKRPTLEGFDFLALMTAVMAEQAKPRTKAQIITLLKDEGEKFAKAVEALSDDFLGRERSDAAGRPAGQPHAFRHADEREGT